MSLAPCILLIDDDDDTETSVRLALEPEVSLLVEKTLAGALSFLAKRSCEVCGVIVDLNLTGGTDNFGREVLAELRKNDIPCVVFSSSIKTVSDVKRYQNEFGVLGTVGKRMDGVDSAEALQELRESVNKMISAALEQQRAKTQKDLQERLLARQAKLETEAKTSEDAKAELERIAGSSSAQKFSNAEQKRLNQLREAAQKQAAEVVKRVLTAKSIDELQQVRSSVIKELERNE